MKKISLILVFALLTAILAGCGGNSELESQVSNLQEQLTLLQDRVALLEAENENLKARLDSEVIIPIPESGTYHPAAEFFFGDWTESEGVLTLTDGFVRVSGLTMADGQMADIAACELVLYCGGMELGKDILRLHPGEASDSFELELDTLRYELPGLSVGDALELILEVTLSDSTVLTVWGGNWEYDGGNLVMIAG